MILTEEIVLCQGSFVHVTKASLVKGAEIVTLVPKEYSDWQYLEGTPLELKKPLICLTRIGLRDKWVSKMRERWEQPVVRITIPAEVLAGQLVSLDPTSSETTFLLGKGGTIEQVLDESGDIAVFEPITIEDSSWIEFFEPQ